VITIGMSVTTGELPSAGGPSATRIIQTPETVIVLAGASLDTSQQPNDGWYTEALGKHLAAGLATTPSIDLRTALQQAIATLARQYRLVAGASPAATVSIVRRRSDHIDALVLGSTPVITLTAKGKIIIVRDDRLTRLITRAPEHAAYRARLRVGGGFEAPEHHDLLRRLREHQIRHANRATAQAYWVAEAVPQAARHAVVAAWPTSDLTEILIATAGVSAAVEEYPVFASWTELAAVCRDRGPGQAVRVVHEAERADPTGVRWPREEPHADKALAVVTFARPA
jgi:hypothetical protein